MGRLDLGWERRMAQAAKRVRRDDARREMLRSMDPRTGEVTREIPANTVDEVHQAVAAARRAGPSWAGLTVAERARHLGRIRHLIHERTDHIVAVVSRENGKPPAEALAHDVLTTLITLAYLGRVGPQALRPRAVGRLIGPLFGSTSRIEWRPYGVVGCVSPWNYPLFLSFMAAVPALLAGNTVVVKPSEATPAVGEVVAELLEVLPPGVASVVQGGAEVGAALIDAPCDKLSFIGSAPTGRKVAEGAARHLTPVVMELGGQDATVVCEDADLDVAASGVLWGSFLNAGQTCCAIERAYVVDSVADRFEELLVEKLARVRGDRAGDIGPLTLERQREIVQRHVRDAVERGATVLAGGVSQDGGKGGTPTTRPPRRRCAPSSTCCRHLAGKIAARRSAGSAGPTCGPSGPRSSSNSWPGRSCDGSCTRIRPRPRTRTPGSV